MELLVQRVREDEQEEWGWGCNAQGCRSELSMVVNPRMGMVVRMLAPQHAAPEKWGHET